VRGRGGGGPEALQHLGQRVTLERVAGHDLQGRPPDLVLERLGSALGHSLVYLARRRQILAQGAAQHPWLYRPVGAAHLARRPLPEPAARALTDATLATGAAFTAGTAHRVTGPAYASLLLWTLSYRNSWSMVFHTDNQMVLHATVLGLSRSADAWSIDAALRPSRNGRGGTAWHYGWPLRIMRTVTACAYLVAGVAKVKGPMGWRWATGESLRRQVAADGLRKEVLGTPAAPATYALYDKVALFRVLAVGSPAVELLAPAALLSSACRACGHSTPTPCTGASWP
jgi:hypothetical protein